MLNQIGLTQQLNNEKKEYMTQIAVIEAQDFAAKYSFESDTYRCLLDDQRGNRKKIAVVGKPIQTKLKVKIKGKSTQWSNNQLVYLCNSKQKNIIISVMKNQQNYNIELERLFLLIFLYRMIKQSEEFVQQRLVQVRFLNLLQKRIVLILLIYKDKEKFCHLDAFTLRIPKNHQQLNNCKRNFNQILIIKRSFNQFLRVNSKCFLRFYRQQNFQHYQYKNYLKNIKLDQFFLKHPHFILLQKLLISILTMLWIGCQQTKDWKLVKIDSFIEKAD
ncbi:unnamed protein product [Paramecium sonneborni]|uniref:Uncharacterized protein n=1 Tax=Paramecium sonneborni TaxID=65129 RepID=A0A8S1JXZ6_9CILI|nr:unnamed protein product [Paramecium sonneborni]